MRAARSASPRIVSRPCADLVEPACLRDSRSAQHQDRGERVVQLVRDARNRLSERRHLLGLQELLVEVARLVVELLALADVAQERVDAQDVRGRGRAARCAGHLDPDGAAVGAPESQQVVGDARRHGAGSRGAPHGPPGRRTGRGRTGARRPEGRRPDSRRAAAGTGWRRSSCSRRPRRCPCGHPRGPSRRSARRRPPAAASRPP